MERLIVICEGGIHTVDYLQKNGVYPAAMVIEPSKFQDMSPYLTKEDDILLIIKGLTDFTMASIYGLLNKFKEYKDKYKRVTILTNIPLGNIDFDYYLYDGDIFYGSVKLISNKKEFELNEQGEIVENQNKFSFMKKKVQKLEGYNPIMHQFKKYNNKKIKIMIYGKVNMNEKVVVPEFDYEKQVRVVDLYNENKKAMEE